CRQPFEIIEREFGFAVGALAADRDLLSPDVDLWNVREMVTDEKRVVRRDGGAEIFERGLVVRWPVTQLDQGLLSRQRVEHCVAARALGKRGWQIKRPSRCFGWREAQPRAGEREARAGRDETPASEHGVLLPPIIFL